MILNHLDPDKKKETEFLRTKKSKNKDTGIVVEQNTLKEKLMKKIDQELDKIRNPQDYKPGNIKNKDSEKVSRIPSVQPILNLISIDKDSKPIHS